MKYSFQILTIHLFLFAVFTAEAKETAPTNVSVAQPTSRAQDLRNGSVFHINTSSSVITQNQQVSIKMSADRIRIKRRGQSKASLAGVGARVFPKDTLITDAKTTAQVAMNDGTRLSMACLTRLSFQERFFLGQDLISVLKLWHGLVRVKVTDTVNNGGFTLKTTAAICRSSKPVGFVAQHFEARQLGKRGHTQITLMFGSLRVRDLIKGENHLLDTPGETIICSDTGTEKPPACLDIGKLKASDLAKFLPLKPVPEPTEETPIPIPPPIEIPLEDPTPAKPSDDPLPDPDDDLILDNRPGPNNPPPTIPTDETDITPLSP